MPRKSGLLLAVPALPSRWGAGGMGREADEFADFLVGCGQRLWQVLPLTIPDFVHSPYASSSAFAGDPMLIDPAVLYEMGLLSRAEIQPPLPCCPARIDYEAAGRAKSACLRRAYDAFRTAGGTQEEAYRSFCRRERYWLDDFALYDALKTHFGGRPFWEWPEEGARFRRPAALRRLREQLCVEVQYRCFTQYLFSRQLSDLRSRLKGRGISLIGDIPFYVARDSADVWAHPEFFCLREDLRPRLQAGVPPDFFAERGQLWGNPVYDWEAMAQDGYRFWIRRLMRCSSMYDVTRLDHFRALDSYYVVRGGACDAITGRWRIGPGTAFFDALYKRCPTISLIAEDLGELTPSVHELRRRAGIPGMRVLQFAFGSGADNVFLPHNYERSTVAYLGTHDNDTAAGWWIGLGAEERAHAAAYLGLDVGDGAARAVRRMMRALSASAAESVIFTVQDLSAADSSARINTPSRIGGCWEYAAPAGFAGREDARFLRSITELYGRT